nr:glycosyltransferase family 2 protein [Lachnospiraceae bacterium]
MTVSCIVPVYNSGKYLKKCADSMLSQTVPPDELILVDDGSADESPGICDRYAEENDTVKVIHKENGGLISAWKAGVKASSADLLTFLDADDYVDPDYLENLLRGASDACDKQIVSCGGITESENT